jgi:hypothetical protein
MAHEGDEVGEHEPTAYALPLQVAQEKQVLSEVAVAATV